MRGYDEFLGRVFEVIPPGLMLLILLAVTGLVAALWYWHPAWVSWRLPRFTWKKPSWKRWRRKKKAKHGKKKEPVLKSAKADKKRKETKAPALVRQSTADRLASEGRYAEAIRERLRDTVADLTRAGVIDPEPGTTAAELTTAASTGRPRLSPPLTGATGLFSEIWYGHRPAGRGEDEKMREMTAEVRAALQPGPGADR
ncbi:hypothetical protein GCM10010112_71080 [Actinoplanes lobatus]|uniref:Protein-glutamine gamma-glutamyltransferase-like C-terminal domain-containing protein n=1 Tax=Actinoplanes lobatus TaxID=113568 RepID=A0A7W7MJX1_9ACTN|nr:DUF4129 domain-containing protein [Actinoplanes lobatus]MBB4752913.1 hypothetical protein [Actinoplanes lobatus]GGN87983.1 hypothetical protein GCM10010112_71080 [Actinoplanes lobatus]GIE39521.1 hypothetical protein Alo02nite_24190 [Actinoplanes lobatus]